MLLLVAGLCSIHGQSRSMPCVFQTLADGGYTCSLTTSFVGLTAVTITTGNHQSGRSNADVTSFQIINQGATFFPVQVFQQFPNLRHVRFDRNNMPRLDANVFARRTNLVFLSIDRSEVRILDTQAFAGLTRLTHLYLGFNNIASLPNGVFNDLTSLLEFHMDLASLSFLNGNLFANSPQLQHLEFSHNNIFFIERSFFNNLRNLRIIRFLGNTCLQRNFNDISNGDLTAILPFFERCFSNTPI